MVTQLTKKPITVKSLDIVGSYYFILSTQSFIVVEAEKA